MIYQFIDTAKPKSLSFQKACRIFAVSPSGFFKSRKAKNQLREGRETAIRRAFLRYKQRYGYRKIAHDLTANQGILCSPAQARRFLNKQGLKAWTNKSFKPQTTESGHGRLIAERVFKTEKHSVPALNQVWGSDITYLRAKSGKFLYLAVFLDFCSRKIVGWELSAGLSADLVLQAFDKALKSRCFAGKGLIIHSDRGVQYTAGEFRKRLKSLGFIQSMSRKGNCYDNAYCESCFSLLKRELGGKVYSDMGEAREEIFEWIEGWYNTQRLHSALGYKSPVEFEKITQRNMGKTS